LVGGAAVRELCHVVQQSGSLLAGNAYVDQANDFVIVYSPSNPYEYQPFLSGHSTGGLLMFLYMVANGIWAGPPDLGLDNSPPRPLSFRTLLAGAAA